MALELTKEQTTAVVASLKRYFTEQLEQELSDMQARFLTEYLLKEIAPIAYNQGVEDARRYFREKMEDLPGTCFEAPLGYWKGRDGRKKR